MLEGKFSIYIHMQETDTFHIDFIDQSSYTYFLRVEMSTKDLMLALAGRSELPCKFELLPAHVGKVREHKHEWVEVPENFRELSDAEAREILAPFEVDGWHGYFDDLRNWHHYDRNRQAYDVSFTRFVDPE